MIYLLYNIGLLYWSIAFNWNSRKEHFIQANNESIILTNMITYFVLLILFPEFMSKSNCPLLKGVSNALLGE